MKNYGKRLIPRNANEFADLVLPHIQSNPTRAVDILYSFSRRKKRNPNDDFETAPLLTYIAFHHNIELNIQVLCALKFTFINGVPDELDQIVKQEATEELKKQYSSVQDFLRLFVKRIKIDSYRCTIDLEYYEIEKLSKLVTEYGAYSKSWQYGLANRRKDICGNFLLQTALQNLLMEAHSKVRAEKGLQPILSKWKNEQMLFDRIKLSFPNLVVIGQGSPTWLEGQKFDIWMPQFNIAIEYNGTQHFQPVSFFGGEEGLQKTKERDELKRLKCAQNNTSLFELNENYDFDDLRNKIQVLIDSAGSA